MALLGHILDAFRIYCPYDSLTTWISGMKTRDEIRTVAKKIQTELCSARRVSRLRHKPLIQRDVPLENIILFNHMSIFLREFGDAIKHGDIG